VTEEPPTPDQLKSILEYVGAQKASTIIRGAKNESDAMRKLKENVDNFNRPIVCFPFGTEMMNEADGCRRSIGQMGGPLRGIMSRRL
jgi:hypothetical protein